MHTMHVLVHWYNYTGQTKLPSYFCRQESVSVSIKTISDTDKGAYIEVMHEMWHENKLRFFSVC